MLKAEFSHQTTTSQMYKMEKFCSVRLWISPKVKLHANPDSTSPMDFQFLCIPRYTARNTRNCFTIYWLILWKTRDSLETVLNRKQDWNQWWGNGILGTLRGTALGCAITKEVSPGAVPGVPCQNAATETCTSNVLLVHCLLRSTIQNGFAQSEENIAPYTGAACLKSNSCSKQYGFTLLHVTEMHKILSLLPGKQLPLQPVPILGQGWVWLEKATALKWHRFDMSLQSLHY